METNIKKVHTVKDLTISFALIAIGAGLFFVNKGCGFCIAALGLLLFFLYRTGYKIGDDHKTYHKKSLDLCRGCKEPLVNFLEGKTSELDIKEGSEGGCIRVDFYFCAPDQPSYIQVFDFRGYEYQKDGELREADAKQTKTLLNKL